MSEHTTPPTIQVPNGTSLCSFCNSPLSPKTLHERWNAIEAGRSLHVAEFTCGTVWFLPDAKGLQAYYRKCGPNHLRTFYGPKS